MTESETSPWSEYIRGVTSEAMLEQVRVLTEENGEA